MALCLAHAAAGYLGYEAVRPAERHRPGLLVAAVVLANAPDLDFIPGFLAGHPAAYHRGVTHTVVAVVAVGLAAALVARILRPGTAVRTGAWVTAVYASHLLVDYFTADVRPPSGARFLWPFSDGYYIAPVTPFAEIVIDPGSRAGFLASLVEPHALAVWGGELAGLVCIVAGAHVLRLACARAGSDAREVSEGQ